MKISLTGRNGPMGIDITSSICTAGEQCLIQSGVPLDISFKFIPEFDTNTVTPQLYGLMENVDMEMPLPDEMADGCADIAEGCPLIAGNQYTYTVEIPLGMEFPVSDIELIFELLLLSDDGEILVCIAVDALIP